MYKHNTKIYKKFNYAYHLHRAFQNFRLNLKFITSIFMHIIYFIIQITFWSISTFNTWKSMRSNLR